MEFKLLVENDFTNWVEFLRIFKTAKLVKLNVLGQYQEYKVKLQLNTLKKRLKELSHVYSMYENQVIIKSY